MEFSFLEYFYTDKYNEKIIIKNNYKSYSVFEIKKLVKSQISYLKTVKNKNIILNSDNYFNFVINFISCLFLDKNIFITNSNNITAKVKNVFEVDEISKSKNSEFEFKKINPKNKIFFHTSGTTDKPKLIEKDYNCLANESQDTILEFKDIYNKNYEFITTTPINHIFATVFYFILALDSKNILNTSRINYPEDLTVENSILITSPSFLSYMEKYGTKPNKNPCLIFTAGAKLNNSTHNYFNNFSKTVNVYGSTETNTIGYKINPDDSFKLYRGVKVRIKNNETYISTNYSIEDVIKINDNITLNPDNTIEFINRNDRIFKIQEKRVSAYELEKEILKNEFAKNSYMVNLENKLGAIVELNEKGFKFLKSEGVFKLTKNFKSNLSNKFSIIPQKWKFVDEIPKNSMGKIDNEKILDLFNLNLSIPYVLKKEIKENQAVFELFFYRNCNFFKGHFDGFPIVPGVVQLYLASYFAKIAFNDDCFIGQIKRIKFSNIIKPDKTIKLKLEKTQNSINFEYLDNEKSYSMASLPNKNIFEGNLNE